MILDDSLDVAFASRVLARKQAVIDEVGGQKLIKGIQISLGLRVKERRTTALFFS